MWAGEEGPYSPTKQAWASGHHGEMPRAPQNGWDGTDRIQVPGVSGSGIYRNINGPTRWKRTLGPSSFTPGEHTDRRRHALPKPSYESV